MQLIRSSFTVHRYVVSLLFNGYSVNAVVELKVSSDASEVVQLWETDDLPPGFKTWVSGGAGEAELLRVASSHHARVQQRPADSLEN